MEPKAFSKQVTDFVARMQHWDTTSDTAPRDRLAEAMQDLETAVEELQVADEELRHQHDELVATRQTLEAQKERYRDLFEFAPDAYVVTDERGMIWEANRACSSLLGVEANHLVRKPLTVFILDDFRPEFWTVLDRLRKEPVVREWEMKVKRRDGVIVDVSATAAAVQKRSDHLFGIRWLFHDITHRRKNEEQVRRLNAELEQRVRARTRDLEAARAQLEVTTQKLALIVQVGTAVASAADLETAMQTVVRLVTPDMADHCEISVTDEDGRPRLVAAAHAKELTHTPPLFAVENALGSAASGHYPMVNQAVLELFARDDEHHRQLRDLGLHSLIGVPLMTHGKTIGLLILATSWSGRDLGPDEFIVAQELARRVAFAIDNTQLVQRVKHASQLKDDFIALLAHELRNPLAPIVNALSLIQSRPEDRATVEWARDVAKRKADYMARLIDDLLDISKAMRGKLNVRRERIELLPLVSRALETVRPTVDSRGHQVHSQFPATPVWLDGDPVRLEQVFANLLLNAARYTPSGGQIWLSGHIIEGSSDSPVVEVRVQDSGIGMSPEELARVFQPFEQAGTPADYPREGLGLGLSLVRALVEIHEGTVEGSSEGYGKGTTFVVRLPMQSEPEDGAQGTRQEGLAPPNFVSCRVLVVEDQQPQAESLARLLEMWGHEVSIAPDAATGLTLATTQTPDIVLLDIGLPGMDGIEMARKLRQQPALGHMVLIALSGFGQETDRERARQAGFDEYMVKPADPEKLRALLRHVRR
jgi:PAS domain S-box-containing protein